MHVCYFTTSYEVGNKECFMGKNSDENEISDVWTIVHVNTISPVANVALTICHKD